MELHLHLEACLRPESLSRLNIGWEAESELGKPGSHFADFTQFRERFYSLGAALQRETDFRFLGRDIAWYIRDQGLDWCELSWTPAPYLEKGLSLQGILEELQEVLAQEVVLDKTCLILDIQRDHGERMAERVYEWLFLHQPAWIRGIGLTGDEFSRPSQVFAPWFEEASRLGLGRTAHAGEYGPPEIVLECISALQVQRIGHGIRLVEDPAGMAYARSKGIHFEICPGSNLSLGRAGDLASHPVNLFRDQGMSFSIHSDDPVIFGNSLLSEYEALESAGVLNRAQILHCLQQAALHAFAPDKVRQAWFVPG